MIITVTGKPCSGKGAASKIFCEKYGFDYLCAGDIMRDVAKQKGYSSVLEFQQKAPDVVETDNYIDNKIAEIGKQRKNDNLLIDSRLAWHFAGNSFKVFIDVDIDVASERLYNANRPHEKVESIEQAKQKLLDRWKTENDRYQRIYSVSNTRLDQYDLVIDSSKITPEQTADKIYKAYKKVAK